MVAIKFDLKQPIKLYIMNDKLQQAYLRAKEKSLQYDGVLGVGYGTKISNGKPVIDESIIVFVEKKNNSQKCKEGVFK